MTLLASAFVALLAFVPGNLGTALSQTAGAPPPSSGGGGGGGSPAPSGPAPTTAVVSPTTGGSVTAPAAQLTVSVPPGAAGQPIVIAVVSMVPEGTGLNTAAVQALSTQNIPPPPAPANGPLQIVDLFQIEATLQSGAPVGTLAVPATMTVNITPQVLALAGGSMANLQLQFFDASARVWVLVPTSAVGQSLQTQTNHFSVWAVTVQPAAAVVAAPAPGQPGAAPRPAATGTGLTAFGSDHTRGVMLAGALGAVVLAGGVYALRRRRA